MTRKTENNNTTSQNKEVLYINEGEKVDLPRIFHKCNNLSAIIYDQLIEIYKMDNYSALLETEVLRPENNERFKKEFEKGSIHALDWLKENDLNSLNIVITKQLTLAIVSDFINFMYESMRCAKNGKLTVAYALLRKPLTDELLILEQLYINKGDFINKFFIDGEIKNYDPSSRNIDKQNIISQAVNKLNLKSLFSETEIYKIRYDKSCDYGLNGITNHALHIVTNDSNYRTEKQNLNFVFSVEEDIKLYRKHYYSFVPYLLIYAVSIIDGIVFELLDDEDNQNLKAVKELRRMVGILLFVCYKNSRSKNEIKKIFKELGESLNYKCKNCQHSNNLEYEDFQLFFETEILICEKCLNNLISTPESIEPIKSFLNDLKLASSEK
ncbi:MULTISPECIES: FmdB family zinc ribbon protein [Elizabethkingia]|uniref:FmdB family zinc ribbon protein n=1 Tax=Elizabethkingia TaxID=308865 RepID=UPI0021A39811|nr:zinc ribbon domain-containing protein [Elizabethkingia anophelis]MCT4059589.1 zinc ribbon domain-containing protein [Elizabethkingia anophelis]MCT4070198.1 zinc ribbon domain-containing protein [Elizabethkingia anophelis]MCT4320639.1 zinc ribbon domain-containing protein [Elizabethkingia anophelis]